MDSWYGINSSIYSSVSEKVGKNKNKEPLLYIYDEGC